MRHTFLDILRGIAVIAVLGNHFCFLARASETTEKEILHVWFQSGWMGVDLFFVLSGFLVSRPIIQAIRAGQSYSVTTFLIKRGFKIYPSFFALLFLTSFYYAFVRQFSWQSLLIEMTFLQSYLYKSAIWKHTWSLSVEEHFYLGFAAFMFLYQRKKRAFPSPLKIAAALFVGELMARTVVGTLVSYDFFTLRIPSVFRMDSMGAGVLAAYLLEKYPPQLDEKTLLRRLFLASCFAGATVSWFATFRAFWLVNTIGLTLISVGFAGVVYYGAQLPPLLGSQNRASRAIASIGRASYNIYLWHLPVIIIVVALTKRFEWSWRVETVTYLALSLVLGFSATRWIEKPALQWRDRFLNHLRRDNNADAASKKIAA